MIVRFRSFVFGFGLDSYMRRCSCSFTSACSAAFYSTSRPRSIIVEGNIASGKTAFLNYYSQFDGVDIKPEPVQLWRNVRGHNTLNLMYQDPERWGLTFQTYVQLTMLDIHTKPPASAQCRVMFMERSIFSARYCFVENLFRSGKMPEVEQAVLDEWFQWIINRVHIPVDLVIYLQAEPEVVYQRLLDRHRHEEQRVPLEYLQRLHQLHEDWLVHRKFPIPNNAPVEIIDANCDIASMRKIYDKLKSNVLSLDDQLHAGLQA